MKLVTHPGMVPVRFNFDNTLQHKRISDRRETIDHNNTAKRMLQSLHCPFQVRPLVRDGANEAHVNKLTTKENRIKILFY